MKVKTPPINKFSEGGVRAGIRFKDLENVDWHIGVDDEAEIEDDTWIKLTRED